MLEIVSSLSSVSCSVVKDVPGSVPAVVGGFDCSSSACSASSLIFHSSPLIMMHLSLKSASPSSITMINIVFTGVLWEVLVVPLKSFCLASERLICMAGTIIYRILCLSLGCDSWYATML